MSKRRATQRQTQRSEFSSDEEVVRRSPRFGGRKQMMTKTTSQTTYMGQVAQLSDEELLEELKSYGETPGPILPTTRGLYQKKLAKLMGDRAKASSQLKNEEVVDYGAEQIGEWSSHSSEGEAAAEDQQGEEDEEDEEEEEEEAGIPDEEEPTRRRHTVKKAFTSSKSEGRKVAYMSYSTPTRHVESSYLLKKPSTSASKVSKTPQSTTQKLAKPRPTKQAPPTAAASRQVPSSSTQSRPKTSSSSSSSDIWSSLLGIALLIVMFAATFLVYDHYTNPENSFVTQGFDYLQDKGIFKQ